MWRHIASNALSLFVVILIVAGGMVAWAQSQYRADGPLSEAICLRVQPGATMRSVSAELSERGAISSGTLFRLGADYSEKASLLKAGSFLVPAGGSMAEIVDIVTRGGASTCGTEIVLRIGVNSARLQLRELDPATGRFVEKANFLPEEAAPAVYDAARDQSDTRYRIALAEGATSWQIITALRGADFLVDDVSATPAEGILAPDSYEVRAGSRISALVADMSERQAAILAEAWAGRDADLPLASAQEALILASIVEKETGLAEERKQVASVFVNRLNRGIRLQTDPTVIYGVTDGRGNLGRGLRQSELRRETPFNTYVINGLPPTPIANPGRAAIEAVLSPDDTPYLFFVADGTGGHAFAETLREHNANVAKWRAIEAQNNDN